MGAQTVMPSKDAFFQPQSRVPIFCLRFLSVSSSRYWNSALIQTTVITFHIPSHSPFVVILLLDISLSSWDTWKVRSCSNSYKIWSTKLTQIMVEISVFISQGSSVCIMVRWGGWITGNRSSICCIDKTCPWLRVKCYHWQWGPLCLP
jgi:hypothetical protein